MHTPGGSILFALSLTLFASVASYGAGIPSGSKEVARFSAPEATQGVAVDQEFFYAIGNRQVAKYRKSDGSRIAVWKDVENGRFTHLNAGVSKDGKLYLAHSNFPRVPMTNSVEIWNASSLKNIGSKIPRGTDGSLTWVDRNECGWYGGFAHYSAKGGVPGRGTEFSNIVEFNENWEQAKQWSFPKELIERLKPFSCSCAAFGADGLLYATGHSAKELYILKLPDRSAEVQLLGIVPIPFEGQGFAFDPSKPNRIYGISRKSHEVAVVELQMETPAR